MIRSTACLGHSGKAEQSGQLITTWWRVGSDGRGDCQTDLVNPKHVVKVAWKHQMEVPVHESFQFPHPEEFLMHPR